MERINIDSEFHCHITNPDGNFREVETSFFDGKCDTFIKGYRYVPKGESWTNSDGIVFHGRMITPWKDYSELTVAQCEYERQLLSEYNEVLQELGVET